METNNSTIFGLIIIIFFLIIIIYSLYYIFKFIIRKVIEYRTLLLYKKCIINKFGDTFNRNMLLLNKKNITKYIASYKNGMNSFKSGNYEVAIKEILQAVEFNKYDENLFYVLGKCYYYLDSFDQSIDNYNVALSIKINEKWYLDLGYSYFYNKDYKNCIIFLKKYIKTVNNDREVDFLIALCYYYMVEYNKAQNKISKLLTLFPNQYKYWQLSSILNENLNYHKQALVDIEKAININADIQDLYIIKTRLLIELKEYENSLINAKIIVQLSKNQIEYTQYQIPAYYYLNNFEKVLNIAELLLANNIDLTTENLVYLGNSYYKLNREDDASNCYDKIKYYTKNDELNHFKGNLFFKKEKYFEAEECYKLISLNYEIKNDYQLNYAITEIKLMKFESALDLLNRYISRNKNDGYALFSRGITNYFLRKYQNALNDFENSIVNNYTPSKGLYYFRMLCNIKMNYNDKVEEDINNLLKYPGNYLYFREFAFYYFGINQYHNSIKYANESLKLKTDQNELIILIFANYYHLNHYNDVEEILKKHESVISESKIGQLYFGAYCIIIGNYVQAINTFSTLINNNILLFHSHFNRGLVYFKTNEKANSDYDFNYITDNLANHNMRKDTKVCLKYFDHTTLPYLENLDFRIDNTKFILFSFDSYR